MPSPTLFETICIEYGIPRHLSWHTDRLNRTRKALFGATDTLDLEGYLQHHAVSLLPQSPLAKLRLIYNVYGILSHEVSLYAPRPIQTITLIEAQIDYPYKYVDRTPLDHLATLTDGEALITTDGYLRDTTIANIALRRHGTWYTPSAPLLPGTTRARLLHEGLLRPRDIHRDTLTDYDRLAVMNAMIGFVELPMSVFKTTKIPNS